jgi:hypothetical protein
MTGIHVTRNDSPRTSAPRASLFSLEWVRGCDVEHAPKVPCIECGRKMPLLIGHLGSCNLRGQAAPFVRCQPCNQRDANRLPIHPRLVEPDPAIEAAYDAAWKRRNDAFRKLVELRWKTRILPVARALLANVETAGKRRRRSSTLLDAIPTRRAKASS